VAAKEASAGGASRELFRGPSKRPRDDRAEAGQVTVALQSPVRRAFQGPERKRRKGPSKETVGDQARGPVDGPVDGPVPGPPSTGPSQGMW
jgi:hypothetical protein